MHTIREMRRLDLAKVPPVSESYNPRTTVGLVMDFEQLWYYATLPQARRWNQARFLRQWYSAVARLGLNVKILHPGRPWPTDLPQIIAPGLQMSDDGLLKQFEQYLSGGGHLLLTCRTALMDRTGQLWEGPTAAPFLPLGAAPTASCCTIRTSRPRPRRRRVPGSSSAAIRSSRPARPCGRSRPSIAPSAASRRLPLSPGVTGRCEK